jgi:hypothetical protein
LPTLGPGSVTYPWKHDKNLSKATQSNDCSKLPLYPTRTASDHDDELRSCNIGLYYFLPLRVRDVDSLSAGSRSPGFPIATKGPARVSSAATISSSRFRR